MPPAIATVSDAELTCGNLWVQRDGRERPVVELHPEDHAYARLDPRIVLRQHPDAYFRLQVKPADLWQPPPGDGVRESLETFLGPRLPGLHPLPRQRDRLSIMGWLAVITSASNAVGLFLFPPIARSLLATLQSLGGQPTPLARLAFGGWFSPLLGVLTGACLVQAFRPRAERSVWIGLSYLPALVGFAVALIGFYSAYLSVLEGIR